MAQKRLGSCYIITKRGQEIPRLNGLRSMALTISLIIASYGGSTGALKYHFGYEEYSTDNRYRVLKVRQIVTQRGVCLMETPLLATTMVVSALM